MLGRHWADFTGEYHGQKGSGQRVEMYGAARAVVAKDENDGGRLKISTLEVFFDPDSFLKVNFFPFVNYSLLCT